MHAFSGRPGNCAGTVAAYKFSDIYIKVFFMLAARAEEGSHLAGTALFYFLLMNIESREKQTSDYGKFIFHDVYLLAASQRSVL